MEFVIGCILVGIAITGMMAVASSAFLKARDRHEERKLENWR
jgi:hypothetical protein